MKRFLCLFFLGVSFPFLYAQKLQVAISTTKADVNEKVAVRYLFDGGNLPNLIPKVNNMLVVGGPTPMTGSSTVNGTTTTTSQLDYEILFTEPGNYTIPAATVKTKSGKFTCIPLNISIAKGKNSAPIIPPAYKGKEMVLVAQTKKKKLYIGEPIAVDVVLYTYHLALALASFELPIVDGGWSKEVENKKEKQMEISSYKGTPYYKDNKTTVWFVPSVVGTIDFNSIKATYYAQENHPRAGLLNFTYDLKTEPIQFEVVSLPEADKPESFINAVGNFTWEVKVDKTNAKVNEPIKVIVKVSGNGNFPVLEAPFLDMPDEFEIFEPKQKNNFKAEIESIKGSKEFEYLVMPRKEGEYKIKSFEFPFFDPASQKYITLKSDSFQLNIKGVIADTSAGAKQINNGKFTGERPFIKSDPFFGNPFYYVLLALPFLAGLGMIFFRKKIFFVKKDESEKKLKLAEDKAGKGIAEAQNLLSQQNSSAALTQMSNVFFNYLSDKFKTTRNEITRANLNKWMPNLDLKVKATKIMDQLDQFRFAPAAQSDLDKLLNDIKTFIDEMGKK